MKFTFVLDEPMVNAMVELIANGPYKAAAPILNELQRQANEQRVADDEAMRTDSNRHARRAAQSNSGPKGADVNG